ncbi:MAG: Transcription elongation factor GreA [Parcubacteria group bacterium ADurb.Bin316]|nr:MAG: Transcription elongation factor GreA [Parcubacteria group bacterium ADurb.Bin316]HOZ56453.1 GreA/GreB family elongation factor [bacterium]
MRVPIRKSGKFTNLKQDPYITREKCEELKARLERLKKVSQPRTIAEVKRLAADGDFSENAAYQIAKGKLRGINQRILEIEDLLKRAIIIELQKNNGTVQLGSIVTVEANGKQKIYQILGSAETDPDKGIISRNSPIGRNLIGKRVGDVVIIHLNKEFRYKIIKIS